MYSIWVDETAVNMALDMLAERGFTANYEQKTKKIPVKVNENGDIISSFKKQHKFTIEFSRPKLRTMDFLKE